MGGWLASGKAVLKAQLASRSQIDPALLPYNEALIDWLASERAQGRQIILCTASDRVLADAIAAHLQLFDEVIASDGTLNVAGPNKAKVLAERFGAGQFDYVGNSSADLPVWQVSRNAIVVNGSVIIGDTTLGSAVSVSGACGSFSYTSSPAPAMVWSVNAATSAA